MICRSATIRDDLVAACDGKIEIRPVVGGDMTLQPFYGKYLPQHLDELPNSNASLVHRQGLYDWRRGSRSTALQRW